MTIRVHNGTQYVETTRDIAFYNGEVTFYDLTLTNGTTSASLESAPNYSVASGDTISVKGKVILPVKVTQQDLNNDNDFDDPGETVYTPDINDFRMARRIPSMSICWAAEPECAHVDHPDPDPATITPAVTFVTAEFTQDIGTVAGSPVRHASHAGVPRRECDEECAGEYRHHRQVRVLPPRCEHAVYSGSELSAGIFGCDQMDRSFPA